MLPPFVATDELRFWKWAGQTIKHNKLKALPELAGDAFKRLAAWHSIAGAGNVHVVHIMSKSMFDFQNEELDAKGVNVHMDVPQSSIPKQVGRKDYRQLL